MLIAVLLLLLLVLLEKCYSTTAVLVHSRWSVVCALARDQEDRSCVQLHEIIDEDGQLERAGSTIIDRLVGISRC